MDKNTNNVQILIVEDNHRYLENLVNSLKEDYFYQNIHSTRTSEEASEILNNAAFDIIIADMRLGNDMNGGFKVLEHVKAKNITSIVIVLTANDTVADCRKAFRTGSFDYISKNSKDPVEELHTSIQEALHYLNRWGNRKDELWIAENEDNLKSQYLGKYIAVINNTVLEFADTEQELKKQIEERKLPIFLPVIKKIGFSVAELIKHGESGEMGSGKLEFKSTLEWDVREKKNNPQLINSSLKTIASFLNTEGGVLLIGVEDNGNIYGIEKDVQLTKNKSHDSLELRLRDLIKEQIGESFSHSIKIRFEKIEEKYICVVNVLKSKEPAFLKETKSVDKQFYIRSGNRTSALNSEDFYRYLKSQPILHNLYDTTESM